MTISNAALAIKVQDLVEFFRVREAEFQTWMSGEAGGGDALDGKYPLTDLAGNVRLTPSPAQLEADVSGPTGSAATHQAAAEAAQVAAEAAETAALADAAAADAHRLAALAAVAEAETARDTAASSEGLALGYRNAAQAARDAALAAQAAAEAATNFATEAYVDSAIAAIPAASGGSGTGFAIHTITSELTIPANSEMAVHAGLTLSAPLILEENSDIVIWQS